MNLSKKRLLVFAIALATLLSVHCAQKEGPLDPYINTQPPPYLISSLTANPARVEPGGQAVVLAVLHDRQGEPVAGKEISFQVSLGAIEPTATTDNDGLAVAIYTASSSAGTARIVASTKDAVADSVDIQVGQGALSVSPSSILADGVSYSTLLVTLVDDQENPVPGALVSFSTDQGSIAGASTKTDASGLAGAFLVSTASTTDLVATVSVRIVSGGVTRTETATVEMRGVSVSVSADPAQIPADGMSSTAVTAWVRETTSGAPVALATVNFRSSSGAIGASATSDASGYARVTLVSSTAPGVASVIALYGGVYNSTQVAFGSLAISVAAASPKIVADGATSEYVIATLLTAGNNPVVGAEIDFSSTSGVIAKSGTTDSRGMAGAQLVSSVHAGTARVIASFKGVYKDTVEVSFENPVVTLAALPMSVKAKPINTVSVIAHVAFAGGGPVPDSTVVRFETTQGTLTPAAVTASGIATSTLKPNGLADDAVVVKARCGASSATTQVVFAPDAAAQILAHALPDTIPGGGSSVAEIVAEVMDSYGNHVEDGSLVTFSVIGGSGLVSPTALTLGGIATARFAPTGGGVARVKAVCGQASTETGIVVLAQMPGAVIANPDTAWISVRDTGDRDQAVITAHVYDSYMNPVDEGTEVTFQIDYGPGGGEYLDDPANAYGPVVKETSGGMASVTVNSGTLPGTLLMSISAGGHVATAAKIGIASGEPDSIFITTGQVVVGSDCIYTLAVGAMVRDRYNNPVENGTAV
ncbi:MAG TPA: Ig-like domain-containing protein, partial [bacterium]|nr:Ig-like domain-containing protein [bacterium]